MTNGNGQHDELPEDRRKIIEYGMLQFQQVEEKLAQAEKDRDEARKLIAEANVKIDSLNSLVTVHQQHAEVATEQVRELANTYKAQLESFQLRADDQVRKYRDERDHAVDEMNRCKVILETVMAVLRKHEIESTPLITEQRMQFSTSKPSSDTPL